MTQRTSQASRITWTSIFAGMSLAVVNYGIILIVLGGNQPAPAQILGMPRYVVSIVAAVFLFGSMAWTRMRLRPLVSLDADPTAERPALNPAQFQLNTIISLALAEAAAIIGFAAGLVASSGVMFYLPFAVGTLAVMLFDVLPLGLSFWRQVDERAGGSGPLG